MRVFGDCVATPETCSGNINWLGDGYCNNYAPYNTEGCCWDGGDCSNKIDSGIVLVATAAGIFALVTMLIWCLACLKLYNRRNNHSSTVQPAAATNAAPPPPRPVEHAWSAAEERRALILTSIIHKVNYLERLIITFHNHLHCKILITCTSFL